MLFFIKFQCNVLPNDVTIKEEPEDYPDYDSMDVQIDNNFSNEFNGDSTDLNLVIDSVSSGYTELNECNYANNTEDNKLFQQDLLGCVKQEEFDIQTSSHVQMVCLIELILNKN